MRKTSSPTKCSVCKGNGTVLEVSEFSWSQTIPATCYICGGKGTTNLDRPASWRISERARQEAAADQLAAKSITVTGTATGTPGRFHVEKRK